MSVLERFMQPVDAIEVIGLRTAGDKQGHPFYGNQYTEQGAGATDAELDAATKQDEIDMTYEMVEDLRDKHKLDFPMYNIKVQHYDRKFTVGGQEFHEGGHFNPRTGQIVMNAASIVHLKSDVVAGLLAHEVTHRDWALVGEMLGVTAGGGGEDIGVPAEIVNHPTTDRLRDVFSEQGLQLEREDGVSDYSRAYWREVPGPKASNFDDYDRLFDRAVNETLAEISRLDMGKKYLKGSGQNVSDKSLLPSELWRQVHTDVTELSKLIRRHYDTGAPTK